MFPCRHRGDMFAMPCLCLPGSPQSHRLAVRYPELLCAGEIAGGGEASTQTLEMKENCKCLVCRQGQKKHISHLEGQAEC